MCLNKNCSKMHQDFFRALTYDHHFRQKSAIYCYRLNSIINDQTLGLIEIFVLFLIFMNVIRVIYKTLEKTCLGFRPFKYFKH